MLEQSHRVSIEARSSSSSSTTDTAPEPLQEMDEAPSQEWLRAQ